MQEACNRTTVVHPFGFVTSGGPTWRPGPTCHVTGATVTTCKETAPPLAPMPCLLDCRTSAATQGIPTRDPTVLIECNDHRSVSHEDRRDDRYGQKRTSSNCSNRRAEAAVQSPTGSHPLLKRQRSPLPRHKTMHPCSVPRTARAHATDVPRIARPVALTPWQGKRHLRQEKRAPFHLRHDGRVKKGASHYLNSYPFPFPLSLLPQGPGKGIFRKGSFPTKETGPEPSY
jgi:hypothetical protein